MNAAKYLAMTIGLFAFVLLGINGKSIGVVPFDGSQSTEDNAPVQSEISAEENSYEGPVGDDTASDYDTICLTRMTKYETFLERLVRNDSYSLPQRIRMMLRLSKLASNNPVMKLCLRNKQPK